MVDYRKFMLTDDHSYNVYCAVKYCKENGEDGIIFPKGHYDFYTDRASEKLICVSNHGIRCLTRIAFLIEEMHDFTIDGSGSEFVFHGAVMPVAIIKSRNIHVKNFSVDYETTMTVTSKVVDVDENSVVLEPEKDQNWYVTGKTLHITDGYSGDEKYAYMTLKGLYGENRYMPYSRDSFVRDLEFTDIGDGRLRLFGSDLNLKKDMCVILQTCSRYASGIFVDDSKDIYIENYDIYRSYGMGILAQKTENVTVDNMNVKAKENREVSLAGDGVHFVQCSGCIKVCNSSFAEQYDDSLNIHGIFNKIEEKGKDYIIIKYVHIDTKGIDIYKCGDVLQTLNPKTLIPNGKYTVAKTEIINAEYTKLYIKEGTDDIRVGDVTENLTRSCDLIFENNKVTNNRGRGMLIAAKGKVRIRNNYFSTPGAAILFESDGQRWYESGGTTDVVISENVFENCLYGSSDNWGDAIIDLKPREEFDGINYYHSLIEVSKNTFINNARVLLYADNTETVLFKNNVIKNQISDIISYKNCGEVVSEGNNIE